MNTEEGLLAGAYDSHTYDSVAAKDDIFEPEVTTKEELAFITKSSAPLVLTFGLQYLLSCFSVYACGKLGAAELAAASLAICSFNITALAVYQGMATCLDLFCSQAYGAGRFHMVGVYFQRCSLMLLALTVFPLAPLWWWSGTLLKYLVPDPELAEMTQQFLRVLIVGAPGLMLFETGKRFLQAQHLFNAGTYVLCIATPVTFILNWILVWHPTYGMGLPGAGWAMSISYWLICLLMLAYVIFVDGKKCWGGLDLQKACQNWGKMLQLALPGVIMVEAEYLAFEVLTILAASFGTTALAAQSIASNVGSMIFQLPFAVAVAVSTRIGHFVGKKDIAAARTATRVSYILAFGISFFNFLLVFFGKGVLIGMFTKDADVIKLARVVMTIVAVNQLADSVNVIEAGVLRGQGRQKLGSYLNLVSYYCIALPLAFFFAFHLDFGLAGLLSGLIVGVVFLTLSEFVCILKSDWNYILRSSEARHDH
ncbi:hypothetical protein PUMCH_001637 [Australozyma saopauloensis]|uniref:MATE efflux family protein n=1 Tax=Australozyma saopauloensis TaxID=291208 RepID=A0AAX4H834_9ASCO|nr:hypothetical protein PUMCH_001637 [[Candida] saopauloensis]